MRDYALGTTFDVKFTTRKFSTGAPFTLAGTPTVAAYPDNSVTEITAGITLTVDFDARTGLHNVRVVATGANGFAAGSNYALVLTAGTVDGVSVVGEVVGEFSLEAQSPLRPATDGRELEVEADGMAHADVKEWLSVAPLALTSQKVQAKDADAAQATVASEARLSELDAGTGGKMANDVGLILADTGTDGVVVAAASKTGYSLTQAFPANFAALAITAGGLVDITQAAADKVWASAARTLTSFGTLVADIWGALTSALTVAGSIGKLLVDNINATIGSRASQTTADAIQAKTDNLPTDPADQSLLLAAATAITADTEDIQARLPAALVGGRMDANVGAAANDAITAAALAADAAQEIADAIRSRQLTEGYAADGVAPTLEQAIFAILQGLLEFSISGTTITIKKLDKATTAMTHTLDDADTPTSRTRAT